jgi:hypothetical protein
MVTLTLKRNAYSLLNELEYSARIQRIAMNVVCKLGNVANHSQLDDPSTFSCIYNIVHEIDDTSKNYSVLVSGLA